MTRFDDPSSWPRDYAPGLVIIKDRFAYWQAPKRYVKAGWDQPRHKLPDDPVERIALCRQYTRDLLNWWAYQQPASPDYGTWAYVIRRYRTDKYSPYARAKANTREGYDYTCNKWVAAIGHWKIDDLTFERLMEIEQAMRDKGRSDAYVARMFTQLRGLASYGSLIRETQAQCRPVKDMLALLRVRAPAGRSVAPTREQVEAVVAAADAAGQFAIATGWLLQFEFCLRAVDVRGQWLGGGTSNTPLDGGIIRDGKRWADGLTWDMFDADLSTFTKVISKTAKSLPEPYTFDLTSVPYLRARIARLRPAEAVGPVIVSRSGLPYTRNSWANTWVKYRRKAGIPDEIKVSDLRAGGLTEARELGANQFDLRDAAQHSNVSTTSKYVRGRSEASGKIVKLRQEKRK